MAVVTANRKNFFGRAKSVTDNASARKKSKGSPKNSPQRTFLTHEFQSLPVFDVASKGKAYEWMEVKGGETSLSIADTLTSIEKWLPILKKEAEAYCKANGGTLLPIKGHTPLHQLKQLYDSVKMCCPEGHSVYIDYDTKNNRVVLIESAYVDYPQSTAFFIPVSFISSLDGEYRQFFIEFMSFLRATCCVSFPEDHMDFAYTLGLWSTDFIEDRVEDDSDYQNWVDSYLQGDGFEIFSEIAHASFERFEHPTEEDKAWMRQLWIDAPTLELKNLIYSAIDGANLMRGESFNTYRLAYNFGDEMFGPSDDYDEFLSIERIMAFCYKDVEVDPVAEWALDCLSNEGCNYCQEELRDKKIITTDYNKPFVGSIFPSRWAKWYISFDEERMKYEQTNEDDK